ncbi:hypothetical protein ABT187_03075 [Streptomyces sp. NPDC001817]|uniref:hypothetical protein n=1 Tax=Streptomyces sp. NPDC001817 TaxID=3154398 RepID=UPI003324BAF5
MNLRSRVDVLLGWTRWRAPHVVKSIRSPLWNRLRLAVHESCRRRIPVVSASAEVDGRRMSFVYGGFEDGLRYIQPYIQDCLFGQDPVDVRKEMLTRRELLRKIDAEQPDLSIVAGGSRFVESTPAERSITMPFRIHQVVDTSQGWPAVQQKMSRREVKRHGQWCEEYGYTSAPTRSADDYFWFYDRMVVPSMEVRYGKRDRSLGKEQGYHMIFRHGILFMVDSRTGRVAGSTSELDSRRRLINARLIGVRDGDQDLRKYGAQNALYHFILRWACENGYDRVDYQGCEPFLRKGTFQYKKRFATRAELPPNHYRFVRMRLRAGADSPQLRRFLAANPVMLIDAEGRLGAGYFHDDEHRPRLDVPYRCDGFEFEQLIDMTTFFGTSPRVRAPELVPE